MGKKNKLEKNNYIMKNLILSLVFVISLVVMIYFGVSNTLTIKGTYGWDQSDCAAVGGKYYSFDGGQCCPNDGRTYTAVRLDYYTKKYYCIDNRNDWWKDNVGSRRLRTASDKSVYCSKRIKADDAKNSIHDISGGECSREFNTLLDIGYGWAWWEKDSSHSLLLTTKQKEKYQEYYNCLESKNIFAVNGWSETGNCGDMDGDSLNLECDIYGSLSLCDGGRAGISCYKWTNNSNKNLVYYDLMQNQYAENAQGKDGWSSTVLNGVHNKTSCEEKNEIVVNFYDTLDDKNYSHTVASCSLGVSGACGISQKYIPKNKRTDATFVGWYKAASANSQCYNLKTLFQMPASGSYYVYEYDKDVKIWACYKPKTVSSYKISYDANGGIGVPATQTKTHGKALTLTYYKPTRDGHNFLGWSTSKTATTATYAPGANYTNDSSVTLYAVWQVHTYFLEYNANGGSGEPSDQKKLHDVDLTLSSIRPTRDGYDFLGWSTSKTATSAMYAPGVKYTKNGNVTLFAVWVGEKYTISYNANGGSGNMSNHTCTLGSSCSVKNNEFSRSGYTFLGWSTKTNSADEGFNWTGWSGTWNYKNGQYGINNNQLKLYARWKKNDSNNSTSYKITYNANGGSGAPSSQTKIHGKTLTLSNTIPTRDGYVFLGWSMSSMSTEPTYHSGSNYSNNSDVTLYAVWKVNAYTVTYNAMGGTVDPEYVETEVGKNTILPKAVYDNFKFLGWYISSDENATKVGDAGDAYKVTESIILYAKWEEGTPNVEVEGEKKTYNVIFKNYNGLEVAQTSCTTDPGSDWCAIKAPSKIPTKEGYTFIGWSHYWNDCSNHTPWKTLINIDESVEIYACYSENETNQDGNNTNYVLIIVIIIVLAVLGVFGYLFYKKNKENNS